MPAGAPGRVCRGVVDMIHMLQESNSASQLWPSYHIASSSATCCSPALAAAGWATENRTGQSINKLVGFEGMCGVNLTRKDTHAVRRVFEVKHASLCMAGVAFDNTSPVCHVAGSEVAQAEAEHIA